MIRKEDLFIEHYDYYMKHHDDPVNILLDFDDVITFSSYKQFVLLYQDKPFFNKFFNPLPDNLNSNELMNITLNRQDYYFNDLKRIDVDSNCDEYFDKIQSIYGSKSFYAPLPETRLFQYYKKMIESPAVGRVAIITKNVHPIQEETKKEWLKEHTTKKIFDKLEFIWVNHDEKKSDAIKKYKYLEFSHYVDDNIDNIIDVVTNLHPATIYNCELTIPKMLHSDIRGSQPDFLKLIKLYNLQPMSLDNWW